MRDFNDSGLRRLIAAVLLQAISDAAIGMPDERGEAALFIVHPQAEEYAQAIDLPWPPTEEQIDVVRSQYLKRLRQSRCERLRTRYQRLVKQALQKTGVVPPHQQTGVVSCLSM